VEAGQEVYSSAGCAGCHGADLEGGVGPNLQTIGTELVTDLPTRPSGFEQMQADYAADPRNFLELWIRDSATNYNDGNPTGMPPHPEDALNDSQLQALAFHAHLQRPNQFEHHNAGFKVFSRNLHAILRRLPRESVRA